MNLRSTLSKLFRGRRAAILRELIAELANENGSIRILDVGGRVQYWEGIGLEFLARLNVHVTLLNTTITEIGESRSNMFTAVTGDACDLHYENEEFDLVHSNSVIEHVETWRNMKAFAAETRRVGKRYFVQTPYFWFPIDPHYYAMPLFHWFPRPIRAWLLRVFPLAYSGRAKDIDISFEFVDAARLLCRQQFRFLFPDADHRFEKLAGLPKSMIAVRRGDDRLQ